LLYIFYDVEAVKARKFCSEKLSEMFMTFDIWNR